MCSLLQLFIGTMIASFSSKTFCTFNNTHFIVRLFTDDNVVLSSTNIHTQLTIRALTKALQ